MKMMKMMVMMMMMMMMMMIMVMVMYLAVLHQRAVVANEAIEAALPRTLKVAQKIQHSVFHYANNDNDDDDGNVDYKEEA